MRGRDESDDGLFNYIDLKALVASDHLLRALPALVTEAMLALLEGFEQRLHCETGRLPITLEKPLRALLPGPSKPSVRTAN
ncbi:MAG: hypothetical protein OXH79_04385 [Boseongicola sp.]|nr:hypothetical protein [Boseongicola sp.]